jgi:hypothetical protein
MSEQPRDVDHATEGDERTFTEHIEIASSELVERTKELIEEGNVRRIIIRNQDDEVLLEVPLTAGVVVGGAVTIVAPVLAAMGALAALLTHVKIEVVRARKDETDGAQLLSRNPPPIFQTVSEVAFSKIRTQDLALARVKHLWISRTSASPAQNRSSESLVQPVTRPERP